MRWNTMSKNGSTGLRSHAGCRSVERASSVRNAASDHNDDDLTVSTGGAGFQRGHDRNVDDVTALGIPHQAQCAVVGMYELEDYLFHLAT